MKKVLVLFLLAASFLIIAPSQSNAAATIINSVSAESTLTSKAMQYRRGRRYRRVYVTNRVNRRGVRTTRRVSYRNGRRVVRVTRRINR